MTPVEQFIAAIIFGYTQEMNMSELTALTHQCQRICIMIDDAVTLRQKAIDSDLAELAAITNAAA